MNHPEIQNLNKIIIFLNLSEIMDERTNIELIETYQIVLSFFELSFERVDFGLEQVNENPVAAAADRRRTDLTRTRQRARTRGRTHLVSVPISVSVCFVRFVDGRRESQGPLTRRRRTVKKFYSVRLG